MGKYEIKDVCRYVLEHFDGLMRLIIFPWNWISVKNATHFASPGVPLDAFGFPGSGGSEG